MYRRSPAKASCVFDNTHTLMTTGIDNCLKTVSGLLKKSQPHPTPPALFSIIVFFVNLINIMACLRAVEIRPPPRHTHTQYVCVMKNHFVNKI